MASNLSTSNVKGRHARKSTAVAPALPLSFLDQPWRTASRNSVSSESVLQPLSVPEQLDLDQTSSNVPQEYTKYSLTTDAASTIQSLRTTLAPDFARTNGDSAALHLAGSTPISLLQSTPSTSADHDQVEQSTGVEALNQETQPHKEVAQSASTSEAVADNTTQLVERISWADHDDKQVDQDLAGIVAEPRRVLLVEDEPQPSDAEMSSLERSNTTAVTDYGSTVGESTLEIVVTDPSHVKRGSGARHRKSEAAPEVLTNGTASHSARGSTVSHSISVSPFDSRPIPATLPSIQEHLLFLASTKQYYDTTIFVNHADRSYQPSEHYAHSLFLSRSEGLSKLMADFDPSNRSQGIQLFPARNIVPHAFEAALRFFYSDHVLTAQTLIPHGGHQDKQTKEQTFEYIMSYWIAGVELDLVPIKSRAYELVKELVDWDLAELVAKEIYDLRASEGTLSSTHDKVEVRQIANSLSFFLAQLLVSRSDLLHIHLDPEAQPVVLPGRFSLLELHRSNNPALSTMVFGSLPSQPTSAPTTSRTASAILINLDFFDLKFIIEQMTAAHGSGAHFFVQQVVDCREEKRNQIVLNPAVPNKHRLGNSAVWDVAGYREFINAQGYLERERVGFLLPTRGR